MKIKAQKTYFIQNIKMNQIKSNGNKTIQKKEENLMIILCINQF